LWGVYQVSHIWSLCVEEQFYLVWPVVIWFIRDRRKLLIFCYAVIAGVEVVRLAWPLMHLPYQLAYESTVTRCDALMMGALLALKKRGPVESFRSWIWPARITVAVVLAFVLARALLVGQALPYDAFGLAVLMPLMNLMAMAIVVLTIEPSTWMSRICSYPAAVRLGVLTYSVYLIHMPLLPLFATRVMPWLAQRTGSWFVGRLLGTAIAMVVTYTLASLTYRYIELPVQELKSRFRYGGPKSQHPHVIRFKRAVRETVLGEAAAEDGHAAMERRAAQERQPAQERHPAKEQRTA
jgi:peptidoglycan/LPS O-acetylase OafA/YrhL